MLKGNSIPGALFALLGGAFVWGGWSMGFITKLESQPGPGFFPVLIGGVLGLVGIVLCVAGILDKGKTKYFVITDEVKENLRIFGLLLAGIIVLLVIWKYVSFLVAVPLFCFAENMLLKRGVRYSLVFSLIFTALLYAIFVQGLRIQFSL